MDGNDIAIARDLAHVNQTELAKALGLRYRCELADIEDGTIEVTDRWARKAVDAVAEIAAHRGTKLAELTGSKSSP